jgi:mRNA capping enzyme, catalytic domain
MMKKMKQSAVEGKASERELKLLEEEKRFLQNSPVFNLFMKEVYHIWDTPRLLKLIEEKDGLLLHENDGLIFTVDQCPYYPGTCDDIIKWKPLHMNTVDFQFKLLLPDFYQDSASHSFGIWGCLLRTQPKMDSVYSTSLCLEKIRRTLRKLWSQKKQIKSL